MHLVTGGAGFIGSHLAEALRAKAYDDLSCGLKENFSGELIEGDVLDLEALEKALEGVESVFHFAALANVRENEAHPEKSYRINVRGTKNVLEACGRKDIKRFIFASSSAVYGDTQRKKSEDAPLNPQSKYGLSKKEAEEAVRVYSEHYETKATILRFANIYGPRSTRGVLWDFFHKLKRNAKTLEILGDGFQTKSYVYISDTIAAVLKTLEGQKSNFEIYNISSEPTSVNDIAKTMCEVLGVTPEFAYTGGKAGWKGDVPRSILDNSKLKKLGWKPKFSLREGIADYIEWMKRL